MNGMVGTWIQFLVGMVLIGYAGGRLARYGDIIGEKMGWSGSWAGLILLSTVTSLPELATGISAVGFANTPNIAVGDVFGSCAFNLLLLAVVDTLYRKEPLYCSVSRGHALSGALGMGLLAVSGLALVLGNRIDMLAIGHVGMAAPVIVVLYLLVMRAIHEQDKKVKAEEGDSEKKHEDISLRRAVVRYAIAAVVVVAAGGRLPFVAVRLSELMGWEDSFVGTLFVAAATSMPELSVSLTALRLGVPDMAVSNLLGSNLFNMLVLAIDDLAYLPGPLLSNVAPVHVITVLATLVMGAIVLAALASRPRKRVAGTMSWYSIVLVAVFILNIFSQYYFGGI